MKNIASAYFAILILIGFLPDNSNPIDYKGLHWMLWGGINTIYLLYILINNRKFSIPKSPVLISFLLFFIISCFSVIVAINKIESLVRITDLYVIATSIIIAYVFISEKLLTKKFIFWLLFTKLSVELSSGYLQLYQLTNGFQDPFIANYSPILKSIYGNKNVTSFSLLIQITLLMSFFSYNKSKYLKFSVIAIGILTFYMLFLISTRAIFVSMIIASFTIVILMIIKYARSKIFLKSDIRIFSIYIFMILFSFTLFNLNNQDEDVEVVNRLVQVSDFENDESVSSRFRFWSHSIISISENPILGVGIGNWKIFATKYDSKNMFSYVVPYTTHNDFLEIFAETGIFGFLSYLSFFFFIVLKNIFDVLSWTVSRISSGHIFLLLCFMYFFIDSNLNFPLVRPLMQIVLILFIVTNEIYNQKITINEKH